MSETITAPPQATVTFGGLIKVAVNQTQTLLTIQHITFKGKCAPSTTDPAQNVASITVATDEPGTWYSSLNLFGGNVTEINPADGDVTVFSYDAGCDDPGGPFYYGGTAFSISKPSGVAINGVMSCGVAVLGGDAVFSGMLLL
jgi:hypothetical protein